MPFIFRREDWLFLDPQGRILWHDAYSGNGFGMNNPAWERAQGSGPVPAGRWIIGAPVADAGRLGPLAMPLRPAPGTDACGRTALFIHGDNGDGRRDASDGCIVLPRAAREVIAASQDRVLIVE